MATSRPRICCSSSRRRRLVRSAAAVADRRVSVPRRRRRGRRSDELGSKFSHLWDILAQILRVMALEGVIDKAKFDSFYVPMYGPSDEELRDIIQEEGSFSISEMRVHDPASGVDSTLIVPSRFAVLMRAVFEPTVVQHFGDVMDEFVRTAERRWSQPGSLQEELAGNLQAMLVVALTKA